MEELINLTKIRGAGAGSIHPLTPKAYARAKELGRLDDYMLTEKIEAIEVVDVDDEIELDDVVVEEEVETTFYDEETLNSMTKKELESIIENELKSKGVEVPKGQVKKEVLINLIIENQ